LYMELEKHGYRKRLTSSEYLFQTIEEIKRSLSSEDVFIKTYIDLVDKVLIERPTNAATINMLREIGLYFINNGLNGLESFIEEKIRKYDEACGEAAVIAGKRVVDGDVLMTISDSMCLRRMFKYLVENGVKFSIYVLESRPGMEGFDLADYLDKLGVETYLVVDSAARYFMKNVDKVFIGAEAIAVNGALVGKVGTSVLCLAASEARVRVFAVSPLYKLSYETLYGEMFKVPEGDWRLLMDDETRKSLPEEYVAKTPLFDFTPPSLIDAVATEYGLFAPQAIPFLIKQIHGTFPVTLSSLEEIVGKIKSIRG